MMGTGTNALRRRGCETPAKMLYRRRRPIPGLGLHRMVEVLGMTEKSNGFAWPGGARIAVAVTCLLENWSGDKGPPFSVQTTSLKPGTHDRAAMTWGTYGGRAGVWRLMKILDANAVPATFVANAHSLELAPQAAEQMLKSGHEIAAHSYTQDNILAYLDAEQEQAVIHRCIDIFKKLTGAPPKGWLSPVLASSAHTEELVTAA